MLWSTRQSRPRALLLTLVTVLASGLAAQPARNSPSPAAASAANDEEFARLVRAWTTKPEFISPLVDHLPKVTGVPSPNDVLGYHVGQPKKLTYTSDQQRYFRALEKATPRVKTTIIGRTEEGRDIMIVFVSSAENIRNLENNRQNLRKLADPRGLSEAQAKEIVSRTRPHYHITAGLHSPEVSPPEMVMELAYRLAVSDEPYIAAIRDNVIVSLVPTTELDGRDRVVDWYYAHKTNEPADGSESFGGPPYWGKYAFHDNNRDINYGIDSVRRHLDWYLHWVPPIWHDLHQAQPFLYTFSGQPPNNENLDPILYSELPWFATYEVNRLTSFGMPGVWHFGFADTWSPGYLGFAASNHNGMLRMYEIYGTDGANTKNVRPGHSSDNRAQTSGPTVREWFRPWPAYSEVEWSLRNSVNYSETALLCALELTSKFPDLVVENFYKKTRHSIESGQTKAPHGYVIPAGQRDMTSVARVVNLLRMQAIEVRRSASELKVKDRTFPAGSFIVKLNQPYGRLAKTLLEKQRYPDQNLRTYDDSSWTMGLMSNIEIREIADVAVLDVAADLLPDDVKWSGTILPEAGAVSGTPAAIAVLHNGSLNLVTLRHRLKDIAIRGATAAFKAGETELPAGSFIIPIGAGQVERVRREIESLGLTATALPSVPAVRSVALNVPRIAVYSTWASTEKVGWVRLAFDRFEVPYDLIYKDGLEQGRLHDKYDVIVIPHQGQNGKALVYEHPKASKSLPYRKSETFKSLGMYGETNDVRGGMGLAGAAEFQRFVKRGGLLITLGIASAFPPEFGVTRTIESERPQGTFYAPGPIVQAEVLQSAHPVFFGYAQKQIPVRWADGPLLRLPNPETAPVQPVGGRTDARATVLMRFVGGDAGVLSGLMRGADQIRNRPAIVEAPVDKGRVLLYVINPIYRWQNFGEHNLIFNALLYFDDLPDSGSASSSASGPAVW